MDGFFGHQDASEDLRHIVHMDRAHHSVLERQSDRIAARGFGNALHVIDRTAYLVGPCHIGAANTRYAHAKFFAVIQRLPLIHDLVPGVLIFAVYRIIFCDGSVPVVGLLAVRGKRPSVDGVLDAQYASGLKAVVCSEDVDLHRYVRSVIATDEVGQIYHAFRFGRGHGVHHMLKPRNIAAERGDRWTKISKAVRIRV